MGRPLDGKTALVTGAGRGIGAATARLLAREGARVCVTSRTRLELDRTVAEIEAESGSGRAFAQESDVSSPTSVEKLFSAIESRWGVVEILVNNAAIVRTEPIEEISPESWDQTMAVNLRGPFLCSQRLFRGLKVARNSASIAGKSGSIVNLSSLGGLRGMEKFPGLSSYVVSKFGIIGLTESLAVEGRPLNIRVNCVAPGAVDTEMLRQAAPHLKTRTTPDQIAQTILYFSDEARSGAISGSTLEVHSNL